MDVKAKRVKRLRTIFIILGVVALLTTAFVAYRINGDYISDYWIPQYWYLENPTDVAAYEKEFGFTLPPDWTLTAFSINGGRGLIVSITMEGVLENLEDIREYLHFALPETIEAAPPSEPNPDNVGLYEIPEYRPAPDYRPGSIYIKQLGGKSYYVDISKLGLTNKRLRKGVPTWDEHLAALESATP